MDATTLSPEYNLIKLSVIGSTQISSRTATIVAKLSSDTTSDKPVIVALKAKSREANKLISIVEIAKRELATLGTKCFQYNGLTSQLTEIERQPEGRQGSNEVTTEGDPDESDDAFQTMGAQYNAGPKKRLVPMMTTYLSNISVKELKFAYGYES